MLNKDNADVICEKLMVKSVRPKLPKPQSCFFWVSLRMHINLLNSREFGTVQLFHFWFTGLPFYHIGFSTLGLAHFCSNRGEIRRRFDPFFMLGSHETAGLSGMDVQAVGRIRGAFLSSL